MVDFEKIEFSETLIERIPTLTARLILRSSQRLPATDLQKALGTSWASQKYLDEAKYRIKRNMFYEIYGDLINPLRIIVHNFSLLKNEPKQNHYSAHYEHEILEALDKISDLLKAPG